MAEPFYNSLRSKLNRAIATYLIQQGCGGPDDVVPANTRKVIKYPQTTVRATLSKAEIPLTGIRRITVHISIKGGAVQDAEEPNEEQSRVDFDKRVAQTADALMQSDDDETLRATAAAITEAGRALAVPVDNTPAAIQLAANNADMADFTCQGWYDAGEGDGEADGENCYWEEILIFEALCSAMDIEAAPLQWVMLGDRWRWKRGTEIYQFLEADGDGLWHTASIDGGQFVYDPNGEP